MDLDRYPKLKAEGKVTIQFLGNRAIVVSKRYDPSTGVELEDEVGGIDLKSYTDQKENLQKKLDAITMFLDDVAAVTAPK